MSVRISHNASLQPFNTFAVPASAATLVELFDERSLDQALLACGPRGPELVLGGGSNLLFTRSLEGSVLRVATSGYQVKEQSDTGVLVEAAAGASWHQFVMWTLSQGWAGLENLALIPGSVGASPIQNIGAYGVELKEQFAGLSAINLRSGQPRDFLPEDCGLGYRTSVFKEPLYQDWLILRVRFRLSRTASLRLAYGEIRSELAKQSIDEPKAQDVADAVIRIRTRKLPSPSKLGNAGSFFKNPVIPATKALKMHEVHADMPQFPAPADASGSAMVKLSAAWLIESCGWKGARQGDAGVYAEHSLVLVNHGAASGTDLMKLARDIQHSVLERFEIAIEPEPRII